MNPINAQPASTGRPDNSELHSEPKPEATETRPSATSTPAPAANTSSGPQPTPGGTNATIHPGAPGAGGGAVNNPAADRFQDNGSTTPGI